MDSEQYEKIIYQINFLLKNAEIDPSSYTFENVNKTKITGHVSGNSFDIKTNQFSVNEIMGDTQNWIVYLVDVLTDSNPNIGSKLQYIKDDPSPIYDPIDTNAIKNLYVKPSWERSNLIKVTQYDYVDISNSHEHGGGMDIPYGSSTQRADRLFNNPVYNMELYLHGDLTAKLGGTNPYNNLTKDSLIRLPNEESTMEHNGESMTIYSTRVATQFVDACVREYKYTIGKGDKLSNLTDPLVNNGGDDAGITNDQLNYEPQLNDPTFTEINHHTNSIQLSSNQLYVAQLTGQIAGWGLSPSDPDVQSYLGNTASQLRPLRTLENVYQRQFESNGLQFSLGGFYGSGKEFTDIKFPENYGVHTSAGDIQLFAWHWNNLVSPSISSDKSIYHRGEFEVDFELAGLYQQKKALVELLKSKNTSIDSAIPDAAQYVQDIFTQFGLDHTYSKETVKDLNVVYLLTGYMSGAKFKLPVGKSLSYSLGTFIPSKAKIVAAVPHAHNHVTNMKLVAEENGVNHEIAKVYPINGYSKLATHDAVQRYNFEGDKTPGYPLHSHNGDRTGNLTVKGLEHGVYYGGDDGVILDNPDKTLLRAVGSFDNPHENPIDQMCVYFLYYEDLN